MTKKARGGKLGKDNLDAESSARGRLAGAAAIRQQAIEAYSHLMPLMAKWRSEGMTQQAIADRLNAMGERTRNDAMWSPPQVLRVLRRAPK